MKRSTYRFRIATFTATSVALVGMFGSMSASAEDAARTNSRDPSCREEIRRIAVWPQGNPKAQQIARFEHRSVTVCNGKVVSRGSADVKGDASSQS